MTALSVTPVDGRREREAFLAFPYELHRRDPLFTPLLRRDVRTLLDPARNPFFEHAEGQLFLARSGGRVVGRIAALHDRRHNDAHGDRTGFFGFFECEGGPAGGPGHPPKDRGGGPARGRIRAAPGVDEAHNPRYYPRLVEREGFAKARD